MRSPSLCDGLGRRALPRLRSVLDSSTTIPPMLASVVQQAAFSSQQAVGTPSCTRQSLARGETGTICLALNCLVVCRFVARLSAMISVIIVCSSPRICLVLHAPVCINKRYASLNWEFRILTNQLPLAVRLRSHTIANAGVSSGEACWKLSRRTCIPYR